MMASLATTRAALNVASCFSSPGISAPPYGPGLTVCSRTFPLGS